MAEWSSVDIKRIRVKPEGSKDTSESRIAKHKHLKHILTLIQIVTCA